MMKKVFKPLSIACLGGVVGLLAAHSPANAQSKTDWSGVYVGGSLGYSKSKSTTKAENFTGYQFNEDGVGVALYGLTPFGDSGSNTLNNAIYSLTSPFGSEQDQKAFVGGVHLGFQQQFNNIVLGIEGRFTAAKTAKNSDDYVGGGSATYYNPTSNTVFAGGLADAANQNIFDTVSGTLSNEKLSISSTVGNRFSAVGRLGFLATPSVMIYGLAGLSVAKVGVAMDYSATATYESDPGGVTQGAPAPYVTHSIAASARKESWATGWTIGAGMETFLTDNITLRAEYAYSDYSNLSANLSGTGSSTGFAAAYLPITSAASGSASADASTHTIKVGISFMFH